MERGSLGSKWDDRTIPLDKHFELMSDIDGITAAPPAGKFYYFILR